MWGICPVHPAGLLCWLVHPHACGGYAETIHTAYGELRFTPTHVGDIDLDLQQPARKAVHPHACGGYDDDGYLNLKMGGSPPRMWGICRPWAQGPASCARFTPTHVGDILEYIFRSAVRAVHPHACGGY